MPELIFEGDKLADTRGHLECPACERRTRTFAGGEVEALAIADWNAGRYHYQRRFLPFLWVLERLDREFGVGRVTIREAGPGRLGFAIHRTEDLDSERVNIWVQEEDAVLEGPMADQVAWLEKQIAEVWQAFRGLEAGEDYARGKSTTTPRGPVN